MIAKIYTMSALATILTTVALATTAAVAAPKGSPMGIAIGNLLVGDYGAKGKVTAMFDPNGTVALTFPDGTKRTQDWVADDKYFCMILPPSADGKMEYRCERNLIAGKTLNQRWQQVDSEGQTVTISIQSRTR